MITLKKLKIFQQHSGNLDALRQTNSTDKDAITSHDWFVIGNLIQDIKLVNRGLASPSYAGRAEEELRNVCDGATTISELRRMADDRLP
ncbi:hypothetical protein [Chitinophaga sp. 22620]|uniref:hypothetical protein n=1 Tax=Chitinophaga sp. 22620 TaxID=3453952 RepID=UPI003F877E6B